MICHRKLNLRTTFRRFKSTKSLNKLVVWGQNPFSLILKLSSMGSPCIGNIKRYEKVTLGISMRGEFPPAKIPGGIIAGGYRGHTIARNSARRARTLLQKLRVRIITRSRFVSTWWIPAVYPHLVYTEMSSEKTNTVHGNAKLVLCASGDSEAGVRGSTGWNLDRPCAPPHFWTSRLYDAV